MKYHNRKKPQDSNNTWFDCPYFGKGCILNCDGCNSSEESMKKSRPRWKSG